MRWLDRVYLGFDRRVGGRLTLLVRTVLAFSQDDGPVASRSIAYYALFSIFPLALILMALASSILEASEAQRVLLGLAERYFPAAIALVQENIEQMLAARSTVGVLALLGLLWSASGVFMAIYRAVNQAWGNPKSQLFWTEKLYGLAVVLALGLLLVVTTLFRALFSIYQNWHLQLFGWEPFSNPNLALLWTWLSALLPLLLSVVTFIVLYRTIPRNRVTWRDVWLGGLLAGLIWELAWRIYAWYLATFARYSLLYGSVGVILGFLLWAYLGAMILLLGAEFTAQHTAWRRAGRLFEARPLSQWLNEWSQ